MREAIGRATSNEERIELFKKILQYLAANAMGQPSGRFLDPNRLSGMEQPGIYAEPQNEMLIGEVDPPFVGAKHGIHWSSQLRDMIKGPKTADAINPYSKNDVLRRLQGATAQHPYVPTSDYYATGVTREPVITKNIPHAASFGEKELYPLNKDVLGVFAEVARRKSNDMWGDEGNIIAKVLREKGYSGFEAERTPGRKVIRTWEDKVVSGPKSVTTDHSTAVESLLSYPQDLEKLEVLGQRQFMDEMAKIENMVKTRYDTIKINYGDVSVARFEDATSGKMEHGFTLNIEGPLPSIRSMLSEVGRGNKQHTVILRYDAPIEAANGATYRFNIRSELDTKTLKDSLSDLNVKEYKIINHKDGTKSIDQFVFGNDSVDDVIELYKNIGSGELRQIKQKSEVLGDSEWTGNLDVAKKKYEKIIGGYFGKERAREILKRGD